MLKELSIRNAKRQSKDYLLYFITLACTVSFMYAFNSLIFSDIVKAFPSIGVLPYMIIVASLLIVLIMGWIVGYMTKYILKKRSRELSIYMISGIPNHSICRLIFYENALIGIFAFAIGLPVGILFSQLLEAVLSSMFGMIYVLRWNFSFNATALTCLYFLAMLFYAIRRNNKWISKVTLYDLLYYERQNEKKLLHEVADLDALPVGAYNIRENGKLGGRNTTANIDIQTKKDKPGIDIYINPGTVNESVHIPVILSETGLYDMVYNDFYIGEGCDVVIVAGCGIHNGGCGTSQHDGIHTFYVAKGAHVKYIEKHYCEGEGSGKRLMKLKRRR